jgi:RNA polymerase sigma-70 factor (ECF subfamily)
VSDEARFAELYARCSRPIQDYCSRRVAVDAVDDAVADTFLTVWRRFDEVPAGEEALLWIYGVAYRVIGHQWRGTARRRRLYNRVAAVGNPPVAAVDESGVDGEECRLVVAALARLSDTDAEVLRLVAWEQLSVVAVAAVLGIEPDAARHRLHRARRDLARHYDRVASRLSSIPTVVAGGAR